MAPDEADLVVDFDPHTGEPVGTLASVPTLASPLVVSSPAPRPSGSVRRADEARPSLHERLREFLRQHAAPPPA